MKKMLILFLVIPSSSAFAYGGEFQVNTRPAYDQTYADIAMDANGNFVVVWSSYFESNRSNDIFGRRFNATGEPLGDEFQINTTQLGNQKEPSVAMDAAGNFVVAWQSKDGNDWDIFAQRFDPNGQPIDDEFRVNTNTFSKQQSPKVAVNDNGAFVIVLESEQTGGVPFDVWWISAQLYDSNGTAIGTELKVNLLSQCRYPDVAMDGYGNFTVVWIQDDIYHTDNMVMARQYDTNGTEKADPFEVSTIGFSSLTQPSIGMDGSGHFMVAWDGDPLLASLDDIHARRYNFDGTAISEQFVVNTTLAGAQQYPRVIMNSWREFVIVWNSESELGINERDILGQRYDSLFTPVGDEFVINTYVVDDQKHPDIAIRESGQFVTVWQSYGQDGSDYGIFGDMGPKIGSADFTNNGFVNLSDYCVLAEEWLKEENPLKADLVDDNKIDEQDLWAFCQQWLTPCYQCEEVDINSDGKIDFKDYALWSANWQKQGPLVGDTTGNGIVDMTDLKAILFHWAQICEQ